MVGPGVARTTAEQRLEAGSPDVDLRGALRLMEAGAGGRGSTAHLRGAGETARRLRAGNGFHPHRGDAAGGASVRWLVGLSGDGLLCADASLWIAGRLCVVRRLS